MKREGHNIPTDETSGPLRSQFSGYRTGVKVPEGQEWAYGLRDHFKRLPYEYQQPIIEIVKGMRELDPQKAQEMGRRIGDFFSHIVTNMGSRPQTIGEFIDGLQEEFERIKNQNVN